MKVGTMYLRIAIPTSFDMPCGACYVGEKDVSLIQL